ncbi:hypothetical protein [Bosea sp. Root483D1]|uniref:hypothetical protein n=1 Tax=Bosea sp. Root483D1 TaxID=1736544 RepID=UPI000A7AE66B|nr:hypothetical protein [Bosea sp. Root483D1]
MASGACIDNPDAEPSAGYTPLPAGEYTLELVESDYVSTSNGHGMVFKCKAQIVGGDYDQLPYYLNYNLENETPETGAITQEIAQTRLRGPPARHGCFTRPKPRSCTSSRSAWRAGKEDQGQRRQEGHGRA